MIITIDGGGGGAYANSGSCVAVTEYLQHEDLERVQNGKEPEPFFNQHRDYVSAKEVTYKIDHNRAQLHKEDAKFFVITVCPSEKELRSENARMEAQYNVLTKQLDDALTVLADIQQRDDNLYRVVLQADPIADGIRHASYKEGRYEEFMDLANADLVMSTTRKLDLLRRQLYIQSKSFDEVVNLCKEHDEMLLCIPAIQPIANKDLKQTASGYGVRVDPIYKTTKFHSGMDFSANPGTDVYATGNGTVVSAGWETGYGNTIEINHGFGYRTRYAHLQSIKVKVGQKVVRGEIIGGVGSTGKSTGPHLHYEVVVKGQKVNPVNYYFMDLSAEDYDKMIQMAANHGKVYD